MSQNQKSQSHKRQGRAGRADANGPKYELKHRVAGAAVLMLVAVVVIPMLLSDPAVEASDGDRPVTIGGSAGGSDRDKDFTSRIVPLNINNVNNGASSSTTLTGIGQSADQSRNGSADATVVEDNRPALLDLTNGQTASIEVSDDSAEQSTTGEKVNSAEDDNTKVAVVMTPKPEATAEDASTSSQQATDSVDQPTTQDDASEVAALETTGSSGWVVRVGTFSKAANVESVASLLTSSGFKPKKTPVSTSLGESTRVWLGPYAKRETADKISDRLKSLTGEKGYVTRTNS